MRFGLCLRLIVHKGRDLVGASRFGARFGNVNLTCVDSEAGTSRHLVRRRKTFLGQEPGYEQSRPKLLLGVTTRECAHRKYFGKVEGVK